MKSPSPSWKDIEQDPPSPVFFGEPMISPLETRTVDGDPPSVLHNSFPDLFVSSRGAGVVVFIQDSYHMDLSSSPGENYVN